MKIAIIGAGFSSAVAYNLLSENHQLCVFEKSRGAGGRLSTRFVEYDNQKYNIDHGTPFFEAKKAEFRLFCENLVSKNVLKKEQNDYFSTQSMSFVCANFFDKNDLVINTKIKKCKKIAAKWELEDENGNLYSDFDLLILTIPAPQILELEIDLDEHLVTSLGNVTFDSVATLMIFGKNLNFDAERIFELGIFRKIINNSQKYGYQEFDSFVLHFDENFSSQISSKDEIWPKFRDYLNHVGINLASDSTVLPHFWKYGFVKNSTNMKSYFNSEQNLGICGDFMIGKTVEDGYFSAVDLCKNRF